MPSDEAGLFQLSQAGRVVASLNASARDTPLSFVLERAEALDVTEARLAQIPLTRAEAQAAFDAYVATGRVSNAMLTVVVVRVDTTSWLGGWGNQDQPLRTAGKWPIVAVTTRVARSAQPHWVGHELGHVLGFYDTTNYDARPQHNQTYTRCGLSIRSQTLPRADAPTGAKENLMSYDTDVRRSFFTAGYEEAHRSILECWMRSSGL